VLAVCDSEGLDGKAFLTALALGFEVSARIARTAVGLESTRGFHNPGTQGPFGAAAAVGKLYGLDQETLTNALGIAGSGSAGLLEFAWTGADTKRLHLGRASQLGLESALLAQKGFRGPPTVLERPGSSSRRPSNRTPRTSPSKPWCRRFRRINRPTLWTRRASAVWSSAAIHTLWMSGTRFGNPRP
jgi:2-methylcitrate dehydratase PrpD